jgi:hypothetical protein
MTPTYESSRCGPVCGVSPRHQGRRGIGVLMRPVNSGASVSRAASRTPGHRPYRSSDLRLARRSQPDPKAIVSRRSGKRDGTAQAHGYPQYAPRRWFREGSSEDSARLPCARSCTVGSHDVPLDATDGRASARAVRMGRIGSAPAVKVRLWRPPLRGEDWLTTWSARSAAGRGSL